MIALCHRGRQTSHSCGRTVFQKGMDEGRTRAVRDETLAENESEKKKVSQIRRETLPG